MARYIDKDHWEEEILIPNTNTPILGGQPVWEDDRLVDGFANIPPAILADRTRHLKNKVESIEYAIGEDFKNVLRKEENLADLEDIQQAKYNLELNLVDNTRDLDKPVSVPQQEALDTKVDKEEGMGLSEESFTTVEKNKLAAIEEGAQVNTVTSVAGRVGDVVLSKSDVGLGNVDNTSDLNKPISTATQTALNGKEPTISAGTTSQYWRGDKTWQTLNTSSVPEGSRLYFTESRVRNAILSGFSVGSNTPVSDTDNILTAFGKVQGQINSRLTENQTITITGDVSGSGKTAINLILADTGVTAGTYTKVTVDGKGRVTTGTSLVAADIPNLAASKITSGTLPVARGGTGVSTITGLVKGNGTSAFTAAVAGTDYVVPSGNISGNAATATKLQTARTINGVAFDGTSNITINAVDSTPRIPTSEKGVANGVATLDSSGLVPSSQLPSYVDDVLEFPSFSNFPTTGESGKIYVAADENKVYRWTGSTYIWISASAGSSDVANKLATPRSINGTLFDGSANITTSNWGTSRTLTVGNTGKSVNGSGNVSWSLAEIGALPITGGTLTGNLAIDKSTNTTDSVLSLTEGGGVWGFDLEYLGGGDNSFRISAIDNSIKKTAISISRTAGVNDFKYLGNTVWHGGNFDPDTKADTYTPNFTNGIKITSSSNSFIEIGDLGRANTPFIDFHSGEISTDYDSRIIATGGNGISGQGSLTYTAAQHHFSGTIYGNGSALANLNASNITSGTLSDARLPTTQSGKTFTSPIQVTGTFDVNGSGPGQQQNGLYIADLGSTKGTTNNPTYTTALAWQISPTRSNAISVDDQGRLWAFRSHTNAGTYTFQSKVEQADKLTTPRTINGTSFDGTANITTSNWGTARNITIGNSTKSVNGSGNVSWSIGEIGAVANGSAVTFGSTNTFRFTTNSGKNYLQSGDGSGAGGWNNLVISPYSSGDIYAEFTPTGVISPSFTSFSGNGVRIKSSTGTSGYGIIHRNDGNDYYILLTNLNDADGGFNSYRPFRINLATGVASINGNADTARALQTPRLINGTSFSGTANITTAQWGTARNITIGDTTKSVNGGSNVSWSLSEIGAKAVNWQPTTASKAQVLNGTANAFVSGVSYHNVISWANLGSISSGTLGINLDTSLNFQVSVGGNITVGNPTNADPGKCGEIVITMTANGVVSWQSNWKFLHAVPEMGDSGDMWVVSYKVLDGSNVIASASKVAT